MGMPGRRERVRRANTRRDAGGVIGDAAAGRGVPGAREGLSPAEHASMQLIRNNAVAMHYMDAAMAKRCVEILPGSVLRSLESALITACGPPSSRCFRRGNCGTGDQAVQARVCSRVRGVVEWWSGAPALRTMSAMTVVSGPSATSAAGTSGAEAAAAGSNVMLRFWMYFGQFPKLCTMATVNAGPAAVVASVVL